MKNPSEASIVRETGADKPTSRSWRASVIAIVMACSIVPVWQLGTAYILGGMIYPPETKADLMVAEARGLSIDAMFIFALLTAIAGGLRAPLSWEGKTIVGFLAIVAIPITYFLFLIAMVLLLSDVEPSGY